MSDKKVLPKLVGFKELFVRSGTDGDLGLPIGSTLLISGPPGAGKTTFALALVRSLFGKQGDKKEGEQIVYYISPEVELERLRKMYGPMGWFENDPVFDVDDSRPRGKAMRFRLVTPQVEFDRPVRSSEDLVNHIFNRIADDHLKEYPTKPRVYVIVDSLTALLRDCEHPGEERRQTHELLHRLRQAFPQGSLQLAVLLAESNEEGGIHPGSAAATDSFLLDQETPLAVEDYLVDVVFRLSLEHIAQGGRLRVLEITKSQGANMLVGEHTWEIATHGNYREISEAPGFWELAAKGGLLPVTGTELKPESDVKWCSVVIFPRPRPDRDRTVPEGDGKPRLWTGTYGFDELLTGKSFKDGAGLLEGSVTLVVGPPGSGSTTLGLQFLGRGEMAKGSPNHPSEIPDHVSSTESDKNNPLLLNFADALYISFDPHAQDEIGSFVHKQNSKPKIKPHVICRPRAKLDINRLAAEVRAVMNSEPIRRVFIDGISDWLAGDNQKQVAGLLGTLISTVYQQEKSYLLEVSNYHLRQLFPADPPRLFCYSTPLPTVFLAYDHASAVTTAAPLDPTTLGISADNIVVLQQIHIHDELHRIIYATKSDVTTGTRMVRELRYGPDDKFLQVGDGLDGYTGLLSGQPRPAQIVLQVFNENQAQQGYNEWALRQLRGDHAYEIKLHTFSRTEIATTLDDVRAQTRVPAADLKLVAVDEWWVGQQETGKPLPLTPLDWLRPQELRQFWSAEVEKATHMLHDEPVPFALPLTQDYGILCLNAGWLAANGISPDKVPKIKELLKVLRKISQADLPIGDGSSTEAHPKLVDDNIRKHWAELAAFFPRTWGDIASSLFQPLGKLQARNDQRKHPLFAFDMATRETAVCVFFEFAWAYGAREDFLVPAYKEKNVRDDTDWNKQRQAAIEAVQFLQRMVINGWMPARATLDDTANALLSRQFYSTRRYLHERHLPAHLPAQADGKVWSNPNYRMDFHLVPMPFMPGGKPQAGDLSQGEAPEGMRDEDFPRRLRQLFRRCSYAFGEQSGRHVPQRPKAPTEGAPSDSKKKYEAEKKSWEESWRELRGLRQFIAEQLPKKDKEPSVADVDRFAKVALKFSPFKQRLTPAVRAAINQLLDPAVSDDDSAVKPGASAGPSQTSEVPGSHHAPMLRAARKAFDLRDLDELLTWHTVRLRLKKTNSDAALLAKELGKGSSSTSKTGQVDDASNCPIGHGCSGAWMLGVHKSTRSPSLARDLLEELTSLHYAEERARRGGGFPARKDFYEFHGHEAVPDAPYLSWNDAVRYSAAHARRRDRVMCARLPVAEIYRLIHKLVLDCLAEADRQRKLNPTEAQARANEFSSMEVRRLFATIEKHMSEIKLKDRNRSDSPCRACPHHQSCP